MAETFTLYKLIVLYMLDRVDFRLQLPRYQNSFWIKGIQLIFVFSLHLQN